MTNFKLLTLIESVLGKGRSTNKGNVAFHCPFCHHNKKKLEVNIISQHWHCWVCNAAGRKIITLFKKLNVERFKISKLFEYIEETEYRPKVTTTNTKAVELPAEFKPLWKLNKLSPEYRNAVYYLKKRGITIHDILKYRIGYCDSGPYSGKIIIPSYDANGVLNYFVGRAYYEDDGFKHKNPQVSKDIVGFELHINWNYPVCLVEGAFDAIAIRRNAIPLFGKTIPDQLKHRIIENNVKTIYICLDKDARKQAIETAEYFMANGVDVYFVDIKEKDPSDIGFGKINNILANTEKLTSEWLMEQRILGI
jgi:DNA primase